VPPQEREIQNTVLVFQTLEETVLLEGTPLTVQLIVGPLALLIQGGNFGRQSAVETELAAFLQGEGGPLVEPGTSEECLSA
jgi:hypothetical protein